MRDGEELAAEELPLQVAARTGRSVENVEMDIVLEGGPSVPIAANARPLLDGSGKPQGAVGAFWDMTELRRCDDRPHQTWRQTSAKTADFSRIPKTTLILLTALLFALPCGDMPRRSACSGHSGKMISRMIGELQTRLFLIPKRSLSTII